MISKYFQYREEYSVYPVARYAPSYYRNTEVSVDGASTFKVVDAEEPARTNPANVAEEDGKFYLYKYDAEQKLYVPDKEKEIAPEDIVYYANATGAADFASAYNIEISNIFELYGWTGSFVILSASEGSFMCDRCC